MAKVKYWSESSFDSEDRNQEYPEHIVLAVDWGEEQGTESLASFDLNYKDEVKLMVKHLNGDFNLNPTLDPY